MILRESMGQVQLAPERKLEGLSAVDVPHRERKIQSYKEEYCVGT